MKILSVLLLLANLISFNSNAATSGEVNILRVEATDLWFAVYAESGAIGTEDCQDKAKVVFWREDFPKGYDSMLSIALAAHLSERKVTMWLTNCKVGPWSKTLPYAGSIVVL